MANAVGFEAHDIAGSIQRNDGEWFGHAWALVKLGDTYYLFDPQAEQYNMSNGGIRYLNFGMATLSSNRYRMRENSLQESIDRRAECL